jgi:hypothetical protein
LGSQSPKQFSVSKEKESLMLKLNVLQKAQAAGPGGD